MLIRSHDLMGVCSSSVNPKSSEDCSFRLCYPHLRERCCCSVAQSCPTLCNPMGWQASLSFTISQSLLKLMSIELMMPFNPLVLCHPLLPLSIFPSIRVFSKSRLFTSGDQSIGASASTSTIPVNIQDWSPLGWTVWISLQSKGLSRVFSNTTHHSSRASILWCSAFFMVQLSYPYMTAGKTIALTSGSLLAK